MCGFFVFDRLHLAIVYLHHLAGLFWLATQATLCITTSPRLDRSPLDHKGPRSGSSLQQTEALYCWSSSGRAVHSPRCPASWVKLYPCHRFPLCLICKITICLWDLLKKFLEVYAISGHGTGHYLKGS